MNKILTFLLLCLCSFASLAQVKSRVMIQSEVDAIFTDKVKKNLGISYPIFKAYECSDASGKHFLVLSENTLRTEGTKVINDTIKAFYVKFSKGDYTLEWSAVDFYLPKGNEVSNETSIWFWSKFITLKDLDGDGNIDPILVYGSSADNGTDDGRIKILVYHNGKKRAIRHQNGVLDPQRKTQVDEEFYNLPATVIAEVKAIMNKIMENNSGIFPAGWEKAMEKKKTSISE